MLRSCNAFLRSAVVASLVLLPSQQAAATSITFSVSGIVTHVTPAPALLAQFSVGQTYSASYTFESDTAGIPNIDGGKDYPALTAATFAIGTYTGSLASSAGSFIRVQNNLFGNTLDQYHVVLQNLSAEPIPTVVGPVGPSHLDLIDLVDMPFATALSSDALPLTPPSLSSFPTLQAWELDFESPEFFAQVLGNVTSLEPVPESGTLALMGVSLAGVLLIQRWRRMARRISVTL